MALPTLDLSLFTEGTDAERWQLSKDLFRSLEKDGFVKLINHGISEAEVVRLFEWSKKLFRLPLSEKGTFAHEAGPNPQRGWSKVGAENSSTLYRKGLLGADVSAELRDAREHFDQGADTDQQFPNRWPDDQMMPGFRTAMEETFRSLERVNAQILESLELAMALPRGALLAKCTHEHNACEFRLNHYPSIDVKTIREGYVSRIWPHFDLGVITLLFQDRVGGLEYENREKPGTFNRIQCGELSEMVVNVSETLQRWTNNQLRAGLHRVSLPEYLEDQEDGELPERYSIAYFGKADRMASVGSLKQFVVAENNVPLYEEMTAIEYHQQRLLSAY